MADPTISGPLAVSTPGAAVALTAEEHPHGDLVEYSPEKFKTLLVLLENQVQSSPDRWSWICRMVEKLVVKWPMLDGEIVDMLGVQAGELQQRSEAVAPQLAAWCKQLKVKERKARKKAAQLKAAFEAVHGTETQLRDRCARLRARRENVGSPAVPRAFKRDNLGRVRIE